MPRRKVHRLRKTGMSPGTPVYTGDAPAHSVTITVTDFTEGTVREAVGIEAATLPRAGHKGVRWVDVDGIHDDALIATLGERFDLHPLAVEDVLNPASRPKLDEYDHTLFLIFKNFHAQEMGEMVDIVPEQVSVVLGRDWVLTFQELPGDSFAAVRQRLHDNRGRIRKMGADYLAYSLLDATIDHYFEVLECVTSHVDALEQEVMLGEPDAVRDLPRRIHQLRQELQVMRKVTLPLSAAVGSFQRGAGGLVRPEVQVFVRDAADHVAQVIDQLESLRDAMTALLDAHLALSNQKMGQISKLLTIVATIFIPLTFIVGIYGMNFDHMPELRWHYGYFGTLGFMAIVGLGSLAWFRWQRWI